MNWIDIVIIAALGWSLIRGFRKGLFIEMASITALVLGIWGSIRFSGFTQAQLVEWFDLQTKYIGLISFAITFAGIVVLTHFLANVLDKLLKAVALGLVVRLLGLLFAGLKTALILSIIFVFLNTIDQRAHFLPQDKIEESALYNPISDLAPILFPIIEGGDLLKSFDRKRSTSTKKPVRQTTNGSF